MAVEVASDVARETLAEMGLADTVEWERAGSESLRFDLIHEDWLGRWGATITDSSVRSAMQASDRFQGRIMAQMTDVPRLPHAELRFLDDADRTAFEAILEQPRNVINMAGLVWHANAFALQIGRDSVADLSEAINLNALRRALSLRHLAPLDVTRPIEPNRIADVISANGSRCLRAWSIAQPMGIKARIDLVLPPDLQDRYPMTEDHRTFGARIIYGVCDLFEPHLNGAS
ncbi:MAG: hypothetical protein AAF638_09860 [Pseudomonadota bacterium]